MQRRKFLGSVVALTAGIAGCSSNPGNSAASPTNSPTITPTEAPPTEAEARELLKTHWETYLEKDVDGYVATFHSDSPMRDEKPWENDGYWSGEWTVLDRTLSTISDEEATFWTLYRVNREGEDPKEQYFIPHLRVEDGEWRIWDTEYKTKSQGPPPTPESDS